MKKGKLFRILYTLSIVIVLSLSSALPILAATTADITITATPTFLSISVDPTSYGFGTIAASSTPNSTTDHFTVTNSSNVITNHTIAVTSATWTGGVGWTHSDTATPGSDTVGMKANKGGTWGAGDVIVKSAAPNNIATSQAATTNYSFGLQLVAPTAFTDGVQKSNTVRITVTSA
jgi:hypothetical protein